MPKIRYEPGPGEDGDEYGGGDFDPEVTGERMTRATVSRSGRHQVVVRGVHGAANRSRPTYLDLPKHVIIEEDAIVIREVIRDVMGADKPRDVRPERRKLEVAVLTLGAARKALEMHTDSSKPGTEASIEANKRIGEYIVAANEQRLPPGEIGGVGVFGPYKTRRGIDEWSVGLYINGAAEERLKAENTGLLEIIAGRTGIAEAANSDYTYRSHTNLVRSGSRESVIALRETFWQADLTLQVRERLREVQGADQNQGQEYAVRLSPLQV
jgi:hypothetical protein